MMDFPSQVSARSFSHHPELYGLGGWKWSEKAESMVWKLVCNDTTFVYTVTQLVVGVFHRNMQHYWHSPSGVLISNWLIWLRFFVVQLGGPKYKSTYKEHVRCFYNCPTENTLSGLVSKRLAKTVQAMFVMGTLPSFSFRIVQVLHFLPLMLLNETVSPNECVDNIAINKHWSWKRMRVWRGW